MSTIKPIEKFNILDIECYPNYFLALFLDQDGKYTEFEMHDMSESLDLEAFESMLRNTVSITFNGNNYDIPIVSLALKGVYNEDLKAASDSIILNNLKPWAFYRSYKLSQPTFNHIDINEVVPGVMVSLKMYGARTHMPKLQDLPYDPDQPLTVSQQLEVKEYCKNDLQTTLVLFNMIQERIELRRSMSYQYSVDLRSKSDAQVAEAVIAAEVYRLTGRKISKPSVKEKSFFYQKPDYIKFKTPYMQGILDLVLNSPFTAKTNGQIEFSDKLADTLVKIGNATYKFGIGGLHSQESEQSVVADDTFKIYDRDFTSYYPNMILVNGWTPAHIGQPFLDVYRELVDRRIAAKRAGDKAITESLKITINGTFGKLGSVYSLLYAPELMIQVTITGQLTLLMLIEELELAGINVLSANTDGIVIKCLNEKRELMLEIFERFEKGTNYQTEEVEYRGIYSRDVNNYIAITTDGKVKTKGTFSSGSLMKNPEMDICKEAVISYLKDGTDIESTVRNCCDITKFVSVRTVKGGGVYPGTNSYLGKVVRWVYSTKSTSTINYRVSGNKVPKTDGAYPFMQLPEEFPDHIDYDRYIAEANELLMDIGIIERPPVVKKTRRKAA